MENIQLVFYYLMFSIGFISGRVTLFGKEIVRAIIDLVGFTMHIVIIVVLAHVVVISLQRAKKKYFNK